VFFSPGFNPPPLSLSPFVFTIHDLIQIQMPGATVAKRLYYRSILKPACARAARVLTVSEYSRRAIIDWSGVPEERIVNVGNGVGTPFEFDGPRYEPGFPYILHVGNSRPHKNVGRMLAAFSRLNWAGLRLVMAGYHKVEISARIESAGLGGRVICLDPVDDRQLARIYRGARAVALPSLLEGFGLPVLESMACGTPVVASKTGALPEVAGDAAVLVDPADVEDIRSGLERVLGDGQLGRTLRALGRERARQFSWDAVAHKVRAALEEAAEQVQQRADSSRHSLPPASY
jgi:glycosyltransferase involved in cell wall biosynthesis